MKKKITQAGKILPVVLLLFLFSNFYDASVMTGVTDISDTLYNQNELITHPGQGFGGADASIVELPGTLRGSNALHNTFRIADDFTVPAGYTWTIDSIYIYAYQNNSGTTSSINFVSMKIWNGIPNQSGSVGVFGDTTTNRMTRTVFTNIYRAKSDSIQSNVRPIMRQTVNINHTSFNPGTYWMDWSINGSITSGPWCPPRSIWGTGNTGNSKQRSSYVWNDINDSGYLKGQPFVIFGTQTPIIGIKNNEIPVSYDLKQNFPNPFNPVTNIAFSVPEETNVRIIIYDITGKEVSKLIDGKYKAGNYNVVWNAGMYSSGMYICRMYCEKYSAVKKLMLIK